MWVNMRGLRPLRFLYLLALGLPAALAACQSREPERPETVTLAPSVTASVSAPAPSDAAMPPVAPTASASAAPSPSGPPFFLAEYPFKNGKGCTTATARCFLLSDLKQAQCPSTAQVPQGCGGGQPCGNPDAPVSGALLTAVSRTETAKKKADACCYQVPDHCCAGC
jgi:hypothetical protein